MLQEFYIVLETIILTDVCVAGILGLGLGMVCDFVEDIGMYW